MNQMKKVEEDDNIEHVDTQSDDKDKNLDNKQPLLHNGYKQSGDDEDLLNNEELNNMINPIVYVRGVKNDCFYLILSGKVMICSGNEGFFLEQGAFNYMGIECLLNDDYIPDFSAKIIGKAKLLKITREDYRKCMAHVYNNIRSIKWM